MRCAISKLLPYYKAKNIHPDRVILLLEANEIYAFGEDADVISQACDLKAKERRDGDVICKCVHFEYHALGDYLPVLIRMGKRIAVIGTDYDRANDTTIQ